MVVVPLPPLVTEPLYVRLKVALRNLIGENLAPGDRLPSEAELCRQYGLSRITVRQSLGALANEGVIERERGRGTFVATPKRVEPVAYFGSFTEEAAANGRLGSTRLVSAQVVDADARVAARLHLQPQQQVWKIRRVRLSDKQPVCYQVSYVPRAFLLDATRASFRHGSLYERLERVLGEPLSNADETVEAIVADPYRAALLKLPTGAPLLLLERLVFARSGRIAEYNRSFYNALAVRLELRSQRASLAHAPRRLQFRTAVEVASCND